MAVLVTNNHILWSGIGFANPGTWNGTLPLSSFTSDGINLLPGLSYISGSSIAGATGARLYWNYLEIIFVPQGGGVAGGGAAGGGAASIIKQEEHIHTNYNHLVSNPEAKGLNEITVKVEGITAMLTEEKKQMYRLAKINVQGTQTKKLVKEVKVTVEDIYLRETENIKNSKLTAAQFVKNIIKNKK